MKFIARKSPVIPILFCFLLTLGAIGSKDHLSVSLIILLPIMFYMVWMWYDTYYVIDGNQLFYKSALLKGSIDIHKINEITRKKTIYAGPKPSLSSKGIIIRYNRWDDIYLSPADLDQFVNMLTSINPQIKIVN